MSVSQSGARTSGASVRGCLKPGKPVGRVPVTTGTGDMKLRGARGDCELAGGGLVGGDTHALDRRT